MKRWFIHGKHGGSTGELRFVRSSRSHGQPGEARGSGELAIAKSAGRSHVMECTAFCAQKMSGIEFVSSRSEGGRRASETENNGMKSVDDVNARNEEEGGVERNKQTNKKLKK